MAVVEEKVIKGERPPIPADCPPIFGALIEACWDNGTFLFNILYNSSQWERSFFFDPPREQEILIPEVGGMGTVHVLFIVYCILPVCKCDSFLVVAQSSHTRKETQINYN